VLYRVALAQSPSLSFQPAPSGTGCESVVLCLALTAISDLPHFLRDSHAPIAILYSVQNAMALRKQQIYRDSPEFTVDYMLRNVSMQLEANRCAFECLAGY
jgi:hypothetical protein